MKIACVDKTAAARLKLRQRLDAAYDSGRSSVGYLPLAQIELLSKEELLLVSATASASTSASHDVALVGSEFFPDEAYATCREISEHHPNASILLFLSPEHYNLRTLRRFERFAADIFSVEEPPTRLLFSLSRLAQRRTRRAPGQLVTVCGVKGGAGATSIVSGLAHAAEALGKSAILLDLSPGAVLLHYMGTARWQSSEYATSLLDGIPPDKALVERCVVTAPNGVTLFLPPANTPEIRELWLRDPKRLDYTLACIDQLKEQFDLVLVDLAATEGLLPFALNARADARLLITANDPASVHLLSKKLTEASQIPGDGSILVLLNQLVERGLTSDDVLDFLQLNRNFDEEMAKLRPIPFDGRGRNWIGTGNTFYTESRRSTQLALELCLTKLFNPKQAVAMEETSPRARRFFFLSQIFRALPYRPAASTRALPLLNSAKSVPTEAAVLRQEPQSRILKPKSSETEITYPGERAYDDTAAPLRTEDLYEPPRLVVNE